jgi:hypothetical protein
LQTIFGMSLDTLIKIQLDTLDHCFLQDENAVVRLQSTVQAFASRPSSVV